MELRYTGPDPASVGVVPLPEGWPAETHDEPDEALAKEKIASGAYAAARKVKEVRDGDGD